MRALRFILPLGLVLTCNLSAAAAPVVDGAPRWSTSGPGLAGQGSSAILQADLDSTEQDTPLASVMRDGLAPASLPLVTVAAEVPGVTSRKVSFDPSGWTEALELGSGSTLSVQVFTFAPDVFAYRFTQDSAVAVPVLVRANGPELPRLATPGSTSLVTSVDSELTATFAVARDVPVVVLLARAALPECLASCSCGPQTMPRGDIVYFVADHLRSVTATTDAHGKLVSESSYDAWGAQAGSTVDPYAYTGHPLDAETGLYYAGARYFHPGLGRFLSVDPVGLEGSGVAEEDPQSLNPYSYARNTPTSLVDRDGRFANVAIGALVGAAVGTGIYLVKAKISGEAMTVRGALGAAAGGAVSGALAGATMGASLAVSGGVATTAVAVGGSVTGSVAGGIAERAISTGSTTATFDPRSMAFDASVGAVAPGVAKVAGAVLKTVVKHAKPVVRKAADSVRKLAGRRNGSESSRIGATGKFGEDSLKKLGGESQVYFFDK